MDYFYIQGDGVAASDKTWREVFNEAPAFNCEMKDISELAPDASFDSVRWSEKPKDGA